MSMLVLKPDMVAEKEASPFADEIRADLIPA
jgi:hypothetical protein